MQLIQDLITNMFPSTLSTFNQVSASDRLNSPSHSALHNTVSSAVGQIEAVVGVAGANSVVGTLTYQVQSPDSDGGGHVQTANKGGTGQTSYTKGDLLVATSSSVLSKLAITSTTGEVLTADTTQASGVKWAAPAGASKIQINPTSITTGAGASSVAVVLYSASIAGSILGDNSGIKFTGAMGNFSSQENFTLVASYGNNVFASVTSTVPASASILSGTLSGMLVSGGSSSTQSGFVNLQLGFNRFASPQNAGGQAFNMSTSSVNSSASQNLVITGRFAGVNSANSILTGIFVVEKIV